MKGYSFQELVKLAEAAIKRAGDTMTGNLTTPKVLVSGAQGTESNALTRKDYVDAELAKKLNLTGGTLTGNLTAPAVLVSSAQNTSVNALTRKDYVDSAIAAGDALQVSKAGDTMTGALTTTQVIATSAYAFVSSNSNTHGIYLGNTAPDKRLILGGGEVATGTVYIRPQGIATEAGQTIFNTNGTITNGVTPTEPGHLTNKVYVDSAIAAGDALQVSKTGDTMTGNLTTPKVLVSGAQGTESNALTRKDYVDAELAKKLNLTGGTLTGNLTAPAVLVSSAQNTSVNALTRKDYVDSAIAAGDALQVSKAGDTMTGELVISTAASSMSLHVVRGGYEALIGNSSTPGDYLFGGKATAGMDYETYVRVSKTNLQYYNGSSYNVYHEGFKPTAADVGAVNKTGDTMTGNLTAPAVLVSSAQNTSVNALTRKDYVDAQVATRAPTTHTHTAAQGNADIVASSYGQVGTYIMGCLKPTAGSTVNPGSTAAGSNLHPCGVMEYTENRSITLPGTWKACGSFAATNTDDRWDDRMTLWIRIA